MEKPRLARSPGALLSGPQGPPTLRWEKRAWAAGHLTVAGADEVGRGAWAGPLVAAAVALPREPASRARLTRDLNRAGATIDDSKRLTRQARELIVSIVAQHGLPTSIAVVDVEELDALGLGAANRLALCRALAGLSPAPCHALVDAFRLDELRCGHDAIIQGDRRCQSIALASIVAKVRRDALMRALDERFPEYGFSEHKGYGTLSHREAVERHGVSVAHRRSFAPIAEVARRDGEIGGVGRSG